MTDSYIYIIVALLPISALMVVTQVNPYNALIVRGILGAVAALVYSVLGAADVALTEALVGTMLAITLYAVAVRSSLVMRLGVLEDAAPLEPAPQRENHKPKLAIEGDRCFDQLANSFRTVLDRHYMRLELVPYPNLQTLHQAIADKEIHAICVGRSAQDAESAVATDAPPYQTAIRIQRLYDIMAAELASPHTLLTYLDPSAIGSPTSEKQTLESQVPEPQTSGETHP